MTRSSARRARSLVQGTRRLANEVRASLEFHLSQTVDGADVDRAILTGPAVNVAGFAEALSVELGMPVEARSVAGAKDFHDETPLAGVTVAAGLAVEQAPA
jgi:Tfp pilus assembly PilM family ATPase